MKRFSPALFAALLTFGCDSAEAPAMKPTSPPPSHDVPMPLQAANITPEEFRAAWGDISRESDPVKSNRLSQRLHDRMAGRRIHWTGLALASTCNESTQTCNVKVFRSVKDENRGALRGFFPQVAFAQGEWPRLALVCAGQPQCVMTFNGRVDEVRAEAGLPVILKVSDAAFSDIRHPTEDDGWYRPLDRAAEPSKDKAVPRSGPATKFDPSVLRQKTF